MNENQKIPNYEIKKKILSLLKEEEKILENFHNSKNKKEKDTQLKYINEEINELLIILAIKIKNSQ